MLFNHSQDGGMKKKDGTAEGGDMHLTCAFCTLDVDSIARVWKEKA